MSAAIVAICAVALHAAAEDGTLGIVRQDVRQGVPQQPAGSAPEDELSANRATHTYVGYSENDGISADLFCGCLYPSGIVVSSPIWVPRAMLQDDSLTTDGYFLRFPYDGAFGCIKTDELSTPLRPLAVRVDLEYLETFDCLDKYEYSDIGRTQWNGLIGGLRFWF
jgi:hypothetical protein